MDRVRTLTNLVRKHDPMLYACKEGDLTIIKRKGHRFETVRFQDSYITYSVSDDWIILPLTENWSVKGTPVEWGSVPIWQRLCEIDGHKRDLIGIQNSERARSEQSRRNTLKNNTEAFVKDWRKQFSRTFSDVNVSSMEKIDKRRNNKWV